MGGGGRLGGWGERWVEGIGRLLNWLKKSQIDLILNITKANAKHYKQLFFKSNV